MIDFYASIRAEDVAPDEYGGDMLLFQWGIYAWHTFDYDITRQLCNEDAASTNADAHIWQLSLTLHYAPTADSRIPGDVEATGAIRSQM